jgi:outer membrane biosynthesis protein TonB
MRLRIRALLVALTLSALAHALLLSGGWLHVSETPEAPPPLLARLEHLPPPPPEIQPAPPPPKPKPAAKPLQPQFAVASRLPVSDAPSPYAVPVPQPAPEAPAEIAQAEPAAAPEPVVIANASPSTFTPEPATIRNLPRRGRIAYNLYIGTSKFQAGRTVQSWEAAANTYTLDSLSETSGLVSLFRSEQRNFRSSGRVTERGLLPENFVSTRARSGTTDEWTARFDWQKNSITLGSSSALRSTALPAGSQDVLSLMFQFSLAPPPPGRLQIAVTNGSRFENWEIDVLPEETIDTPLGSIKALPIRPVRRPGTETMDIWLAADYRYLPVRIRSIGRNGEATGELLVTDIRISDE